MVIQQIPKPKAVIHIVTSLEGFRARYKPIFAGISCFQAQDCDEFTIAREGTGQAGCVRSDFKGEILRRVSREDSQRFGLGGSIEERCDELIY